MAKTTKPPAKAPTRRELQATIDAIEREKPWFRSLADLRKSRTVKKVLKSDPTYQAGVIRWAVGQFGALRKQIHSNYPPDFFNLHHLAGYSEHALNLVQLLLARKDLPLSDADVEELLGEVARFDHLAADSAPFLGALAGWLEKRKWPLGPAARKSAKKIAKALRTMEGAEENRLLKRFAAL
jgi:hypothetical protein